MYVVARDVCNYIQFARYYHIWKYDLSLRGSGNTAVLFNMSYMCTCVLAMLVARNVCNSHKVNRTAEDLASFPGRSRLQFLIAYCIQKRRGKAWEKESRA